MHLTEQKFCNLLPHHQKIQKCEQIGRWKVKKKGPMSHLDRNIFLEKNAIENKCRDRSENKLSRRKKGHENCKISVAAFFSRNFFTFKIHFKLVATIFLMHVFTT